MKKTIQTIIIAAFAISITSCGKDATTAVTPAATGPTVSIKDSLGYTTIDTANFFKQPTIVLTATPSNGVPLTQGMIEIKIGDIPYGTSTFSALDPTQLKGFTFSFPATAFTSGAPLVVGSTITFTMSVKDSAGKIGSSSVSYTIINDNGILASNEIELGAQNNTTILYKFLGLANNFTTYTAGLTGTAKNNSKNIDFVYYYGNTDKNAIEAPSNTNGVNDLWKTEINMWTVQNKTKFKATTLSATEFDNIKNTTKVETTFAAIDFATTTTDKITALAVGNVYAFKTALGVMGLAKFTAISADATGSTKVVIICQN